MQHMRTLKSHQKEYVQYRTGLQLWQNTFDWQCNKHTSYENREQILLILMCTLASAVRYGNIMKNEHVYLLMLL